MDGERHVRWNFVSSRRDRINQAKRAWRAGDSCFRRTTRTNSSRCPSAADGQLSVTEFRRVELTTGVTLNVALAGPRCARRHPAARLSGIAPDLARGCAAAGGRVPADHARPARLRRVRTARRTSTIIATDKLVDDIFALAEALGVERFALVGHDWGGAITWPAALRGDPRLTRLAIINAPHPVIFQKSLIEDADQRAASQYITAFRTPGFEKAPEAMGLRCFLRQELRRPCRLWRRFPRREASNISPTGREPGGFRAMLNWYRASQADGAAAGRHPAAAGLRCFAPFPGSQVPTLVIWGMKDKALLPVQLEGLDELVDDLTIVRIPDAGHFVPWEAPEAGRRGARAFRLRDKRG